MLIQHDTDLWSTHHTFKARGLPISSRMTVVRLAGGRLWLHSPVPVSLSLRQELAKLGEVGWLVAPSRAHDLFVRQASEIFPQAEVWVAPGLSGAPTVPRRARTLDANGMAQWTPALDGALVEGMPAVNETLWFHRPSGSLIVTDLLQWWRGPLPWQAWAWAHAMGVRRQMGVSRMFRWFVQDRDAFRRSLTGLSAWPVRRVLTCHNSEVALDAYAQVRRALALPRSLFQPRSGKP